MRSPSRGPRVVAMLIKIEKDDGEVAYVSANEYQLSGAQLIFEQEAKYDTYHQFPGDPFPYRAPTGEVHQTLTVDDLNGYSITVRPPGNWDNKPKLEDPTIVEEADDDAGPGPKALPGN